MTDTFDAVLADVREEAERRDYQDGVLTTDEVRYHLDRLAAAHAAEVAERDVDKMLQDVLQHGTGVMHDGKHVPFDQLYAASEDGLLRKFADAVEALAFKMPPPNKWTPQFVQLAIEARRLAASGQANDGEQTCCDRAYKDGYDTGKMHASGQEVAGWTIQVKRGGPDDELGIWAVGPEGSSIWLAAAPTQEKAGG